MRTIVGLIIWAGLLFTFIYLKAVEIITWHWLLVLWPITIPVAAIALLIIALVIANIILDREK